MKTTLNLIFILAALSCIPAPSWSAEQTLPAPPASATPATKVKKIGVEEFDKLRTGTNVVLVDVRTAAEFEKGRIPAAINIDINSRNFAEKLNALDKSKVYLVNCAVGMRSARACKKMEELGFKEIYDLSPGFDGWKKAQKPIEK